jgi:hypothetical protein
LDEERGNAWICECPLCREARGEEANGSESIDDRDSQNARNNQLTQAD